MLAGFIEHNRKPGKDAHVLAQLNTELLQEVVATSAQALLVVDAAGPSCEIVYANPSYEARSGYSLAELIGTSWLDQAAADEDDADLVRLRRSMVCDEPLQTSLPFLRKDGDIWFGKLQLTPLATDAPSKRYVLIQYEPENAATMAASSELLKRALGRARRKLASVDRTDPVTGLMSRDQFKLMLRRELAVARREGRPLCLMLFQVAELDVYRQTFGVNAADSCLRMVGAQIAGTFRRTSDLSARFDEATLAVAVLGQEDEQTHELIALVERKVRSLGLHNPRGRSGRYVLVRGSWVTAEPASEDVDRLMARAAASLEKHETGVERRANG
jgi:diguanylate cyclase (GGDEF)-like protein/PAS domain S-box-containing protein